MTQKSALSLPINAFQGRQPIQRNLLILNQYILARRTRKPYLASHKLTYRCNLRCAQCPFHEMQSPDPTFAEVTKTMAALYALGVRIVILEGGEPMLWRDGDYRIDDVIEWARQRFHVVGMTTNGTQPLDAPTDVLWVSVDGFADTHNRLREGQVFDRIMANMAASRHPRLYAHITINSQNAPEVPELVRFLSERVRGVTVQFYYPYNHEYELYLDQPARGELTGKLLELKEQGYPLLNSRTSLNAMNNPGWHCEDWLIANANPDGSITQGCYVKGRDDIDCSKCGFTPHTEISMAYQGKIDAIRAGIEIFFAS